MRQVNLHEAKTRLTGDEDAATPPKRRLGLLAGQCSMPDDLDRIGAEAIAALFEGLSAAAASSGGL